MPVGSIENLNGQGGGTDARRRSFHQGRGMTADRKYVSASGIQGFMNAMLNVLSRQAQLGPAQQHQSDVPALPPGDGVIEGEFTEHE